ncbi:MAG: hypothetical protein CTY34_04115 [Methylobacter sp.]|nr:MAG: hypothetical protein CTY34_04115 [Methylobacter sp.]PPD24280.1 MAG: hypothetical protein CTY24_01390 [Methylobacter sp.]PPD35416.1 MAG: hypothetical protein CTY18_06245 [Methylomonas sp.]
MRLNKLIGLVTALVFTGLIILIAYNNLGGEKPTESQINESLNKSISWLVQNKTAINKENNAMLWWMMEQAWQETHNGDLKNLLEDYREKHYQNYFSSPWSYLIYGYKDRINATQVMAAGMPDYNVFFIYSYSCNADLAEEPIVRQQQELGFCFTKHPISPACITHQMMAFRFMQRTGCRKNPAEISDKIASLASLVKYQLFFDFRVVDVYLQRVLMLLDTGNQQRINPRWVERVLHNQNEDGGWSGFQPILKLGDNRYLGFTTKGISVTAPQSSFHATIQGVWLMALLKNKPL